MTNNLLIACTVVLMLALITVPTAKASETYNWVEVYLENVDGPDLSWFDPYSEVHTYVEDSEGGSDEDGSDADVEVWAEAEIDTADAYAETGEGWGFVEVEAWPDLCMESYATSEAFQAWLFEVDEDGDVTFELSYDIFHGLSTDVPGDWAYSRSEVVLALIDIEDVNNLLDLNFFDVNDYASDGESIGDWDNEEAQYGDYLSVTEFYEEGDIGAVGFWIITETSAYTADEELCPDNNTPTIPAPAALLLGSVGTGIIGFLRRRRGL